MAYTETREGRRIKITDPATGLSEIGPASTRANMKKRLAAKIAKGKSQRKPKKLGEVTEKHKGEGKGKSPGEFVTSTPEVTDKTKLGAKQKQYPASTMPSTPDKTVKKKELHAGQLAKRGDLRKKKRKKGVGGGAVMTGYGKGTKDQTLSEIVAEGKQEALKAINQEDQPDDEKTTGVKVNENIGKRTPTVAQAVTTAPAAEKTVKKTERELYVEKIRKLVREGKLDGNSPEVQRILGKPHPTGTRSPHDRNLPEESEDPSFLEKTWEGAKGNLKANWEAAKDIYNHINETLDPRQIGQLFNTRNLIAFLKSKGMPVDKHTVEDVQRLIKESEPYVEEASKIASAASPLAWHDPEKNKYTMLPKVEKEIKKGVERVFTPDPNDDRSFLSRAFDRGARPDLPGEEEDIFGESRAADYDTAVPPPPGPATTDARVKHTPHGRPESYDYDKEDYEGKAKFPAPEDDLGQETSDVAETEMREAMEYAELQAKDPKKAEKLLENDDKDTTARKKESTGNYYIDPFTGFALNLDVISRSNKRAELMDIAKTLPANQRAAYYFRHKIIDEADLKKMLEPTELEQLNIDVKKAQLSEHSLKLEKMKREKKDYQSPTEQKQYEMYGKNWRNAVTNDNITGQLYWGKKMGMSEKELDVLIKKAKGAGRVPESVEDYWKDTYGLSYQSVSSQRLDLYKQAAKIHQSGAADFDIGGKTFTSRKQFFESQRLMEFSDVEALRLQGNRDKLVDYFNLRNFPLMPKKANGQPDIEKMFNRDFYNEAVSNNFVHKMMMDLHPQGAYNAMLADYARIIQQNPYYGKVTGSN